MSLTTKIRRKRHPISGPYIIGRQKLYWAIRRATALMYGLQLWSFMKWQRIKNYFRQLPTMRCCINTWEHLAPRPGQWWRSLHSKTPITSGRTFSEDTFVRKIIRWVYLIPYFYIVYLLVVNLQTRQYGEQSDFICCIYFEIKNLAKDRLSFRNNA